MSNEFITSDNISAKQLKKIFDAAFMDAFFDDDGDIVIREQCVAFVIADPEKRRIGLLVMYKFNNSATYAEKINSANNINNDYIMVSASADDTRISLTYDICLDGDGVTPKSFIFMVKRFCLIASQAAQTHCSTIVD